MSSKVPPPPIFGMGQAMDGNMFDNFMFDGPAAIGNIIGKGKPPMDDELEEVLDEDGKKRKR